MRNNNSRKVTPTVVERLLSIWLSPGLDLQYHKPEHLGGRGKRVRFSRFQATRGGGGIESLKCHNGTQW